MSLISKLYSDKTYRVAGLIFILLLFCYTYFTQTGGNWNVVPRIGLSISVIQDQTLTIDPFYKATGDYAYYKGNYYSDKAPGMSIMALPYTWITVYTLEKLAHHISWVNMKDGRIVWIDENDKVTDPFIFVDQVVSVGTSAILTILAALALYFISLRLGAGLSGAVFGALAFGIATPAWGWATAFFGHSAAGACLFLGFTALFYLQEGTPDRRKDIILAFVSGALLAWAAVIEITSAPASLIIALYGLYNARNWGWERLFRVFLGALVGGVIFISPLLLYNYAILGSPFESLYKYAINFPGMNEGFYGLRLPDMDVLIKLIFSGRHAILLISPLLAAVPFAIYVLYRKSGRGSVAVLAALIGVYYLLWNSSYIYWTGGGASTPRFLTPMLVFVCLPLSILWASSKKYVKYVLLMLFSVSVVISLMCVSVWIIEPEYKGPNILTEFLIPEFLEGRFRSLSLPVRLIFPGAELGVKNDQVALIPFYIIFAALLYLIVRTVRKSEESG